jgi:hypothetical protein
MKRIKVILPVLVLLASMLIFACGGDDKDKDDGKGKTYYLRLTKGGAEGDSDSNKSFTITLEGGKFRSVVDAIPDATNDPDDFGWLYNMLDQSLVEVWNKEHSYFKYKGLDHDSCWLKSDTEVIWKVPTEGGSKYSVIGSDFFLHGTLKIKQSNIILDYRAIDGFNSEIDTVIGKKGADSITFD